MPLTEFDHFFREEHDDVDIYTEYTSSKQRNREKKFLKERHFVPDKDNPKTGMIDSTEIDPKTGKPIRIRFSFDNEIFDHTANARGTDYIHMSERELQKHPDISGSTFAHEDGHLILNRDPEKSMKAVDMITKEIQNADIGKLMNDHGNSADEYIADRNSLYKMGYDKTVRMLKHLRDDYLPKRYSVTRKSINSDPYKYILSTIDQKDLEHLPKEAIFLIGIGSSVQMYRRSIKRHEEMIKSEIAFKHKLQQEKKYNDKIGEFIDSQIKRCKDEIDKLKSKIAESKEERRQIHQKFISTLKVNNADENKLKKELIAGVDELEKQNRIELDFRIKMLSLWDKDKTVSESYYYGPNDDNTSGTSEFDESYDNDPNDCYCESFWEVDDECDGTFTTKLSVSVALDMEKCYNLWKTVPEEVWSSNVLGVDITNNTDDNWYLAITTPELFKDLLNETIRCCNSITFIVIDFDKLPDDRKQIHEGTPFDHDELLKFVNEIRVLASQIMSSALYTEPYTADKQMNEEELKTVNDTHEIGILFCSFVYDWISKYSKYFLRHMQESVNIFESGSFNKYAGEADLSKARGPIMNIRMRPATEDDTENMYNWEIESIHPDLRTRSDVQELIRKDVDQSIKDTQMIMDGDKTIGMFTACMIDDGEWRYIGEIYLIPEYRGKGIGTSILKKEINNYDRIRLKVATTNDKAIKLYKSLGFEIIKEVDGQMYIMEYDKTKRTPTSEGNIIRTNAVYLKGGEITKIENFKFNKVYFGSPNKIPSTMKLDGPLFVSPYPGIASIFAVRPQNLQKYGVKPGERINRDYDEWNHSLTDSVLQKPLTELHVKIVGAPYIKPITELVSGYLYEIEVTPDIKQHIYQSQKMDKTFEYCIDKLDTIDFSNIKKVNIRMTVEGVANKMVQEAKLPSKKRKALDDSDFALVYTDANGKKIRKYPIHDEAHCKAAARMFPRGVPLKYQSKVARKILRRANEFGIDTSGWKNLNKFNGGD